MPTYLNDVLDGAIDEMRSKSKLRLYESDPQAWLSDVLGKRWYSKQNEIVNAFMSGSRTAVKSANGCGKSAVVADLITWIVATGVPSETLCIVSAPRCHRLRRLSSRTSR
jgi:superfamily II DNA or RNA helicase